MKFWWNICKNGCQIDQNGKNLVEWKLKERQINAILNKKELSYRFQWPKVYFCRNCQFMRFSIHFFRFCCCSADFLEKKVFFFLAARVGQNNKEYLGVLFHELWWRSVHCLQLTSVLVSGVFSQWWTKIAEHWNLCSLVGWVAAHQQIVGIPLQKKVWQVHLIFHGSWNHNCSPQFIQVYRQGLGHCRWPSEQFCVPESLEHRHLRQYHRYAMCYDCSWAECLSELVSKENKGNQTFWHENTNENRTSESEPVDEISVLPVRST